MEIIYENFKMIPKGSRFDLIQKVKIKNEDKETKKVTFRDDWKDIGYDMTFEGCLHQIITRQIPKKKSDKSITPEEYIQAYREEKQEILKSLNQ